MFETGFFQFLVICVPQNRRSQYRQEKSEQRLYVFFWCWPCWQHLQTISFFAFGFLMSFEGFTFRSLVMKIGVSPIARFRLLSWRWWCPGSVWHVLHTTYDSYDFRCWKLSGNRSATQLWFAKRDRGNMQPDLPLFWHGTCWHGVDCLRRGLPCPPWTIV